MANHVKISPLTFLLVPLCVVAVVIAATSVGASSGSATTTSTRIITAEKGVVQSTISGSGDLEPASELDLGFKTSGTVNAIYVHKGEYVAAGQLVATLDPATDEVALEQAKATLEAAEANLTKEEDGGESSTSATGSISTASTASVNYADEASAAATTPTTSTESTSTTPTATPTTTTTTSGATETSSEKTTTSKKTSDDDTSKKTTTSTSSGTSSSDTTSTTDAESAAAKEANLASARATVRGDELSVSSAEKTLADTELRAPSGGTITSLAGEVGESVSGSGTTKTSTPSSETSSTDSTTTGSSASGTQDTSSTSSSSFAVLSDLRSMRLTVSFSESEVSDIKAGQTATVTIEALDSRKEAAHVLEVGEGATSSSDVVTYDVVFQLDQLSSGVKAGMTATAEVIVKQAEGVNVPTRAISADSVTVVKDDKDEKRAVVAGLAGDTSTIITSGLTAGEEVVLPIATTSTARTTGSTTSTKSKTGSFAGTFGGGFTGGGAGGGAAGGGPPGGGAP